MREEIQKEGHRHLKNGGTIVMPMRSGKTLVGLRTATEFQTPLVLYPNKNIKSAWLGDSQKFGIDISKVTFSTFRSLNKIDFDKHDCVIVDEIDQLSIANWHDLLSKCKMSKLRGMTATPPRKSSLKGKYLSAYCSIVYEVPFEETTGVLNKDYEITVHLSKMSKTKDIPLKNGGFWSEEDKIKYFGRKSTESFQFMLRLIQSISGSKTKWNKLVELVQEPGKCLIFVETKKQADSLGLPVYYSGNKKSEQNLDDFNSDKIDKLVTINQLNAGQTFQNLERGILLHTYASHNKAQQRIGRILNFIPNVKAKLDIICLDDCHDIVWTQKGLQNFNQAKIIWKSS